MHRIRMFLRWMTALGVLSIMAILIYDCIDIYLSGSAEMRQSNGNQALFQIYRRADVMNRLQTFILPIAALVCCSIATWIAGGTDEARMQNSSRKKISMTACKSAAPSQTDDKKIAMIRTGLIMLAAALILMGVVNGGLHDVLVKAINICTECIGLG